MIEDVDLYEGALALNQEAFTRQQFKAAYHFLRGALYYANDTQTVIQVEQIAVEQCRQVQLHFGNSVFPNEPIEVTLYTSLTQLAQTQCVLVGVLKRPR